MNPELFVPYVVTSDSYALDLGRSFVESLLLDDTLPPRYRAQFAEHVARAFHTLILIPSTAMGLDEPNGPENYARNFLISVKSHLATTAALHG